jgi:hypothetical protein
MTTDIGTQLDTDFNLSIDVMLDKHWEAAQIIGFLGFPKNTRYSEGDEKIVIYPSEPNGDCLKIFKPAALSKGLTHEENNAYSTLIDIGLDKWLIPKGETIFVKDPQGQTLEVGYKQSYSPEIQSINFGEFENYSPVIKESILELFNFLKTLRENPEIKHLPSIHMWVTNLFYTPEGKPVFLEYRTISKDDPALVDWDAYFQGIMEIINS